MSEVPLYLLLSAKIEPLTAVFLLSRHWRAAYSGESGGTQFLLVFIKSYPPTAVFCRTALYSNQFARGECADAFQYMFLARVLVGNTILVWAAPPRILQ